MKRWFLILLILSLLARLSWTRIPPKQLTLTPYNLGLAVKIQWQPLWPAMDYQLERREAGTESWQLLPLGQPGEAQDWRVIPGHTYTYRLSYHWLWFNGSLAETISLPDPLASERQQLLERLHSRLFSTTTVQRWIYDDALGVIVFSIAGKKDQARTLLQRLQSLQRPDGSLNFFYFSDGRKTETYIRNGAIAWTGYAAAIYQRQFGSKEFLPFAEKIAGYLLNSRNDGELVSGGYGTYTRSGSYRPGKVDWASTEHNLDAYFFLKELGQLNNRSEYLQAANQLAAAIDSQLWQEPEGWLKTGTSENQPALDTLSWGGLFYLSRNDTLRAKSSAAHLNRFASSPGYCENPGGPLWLEGSWGVALLQLRLGEDISPLLEQLLAATQKEKARTSDLAWAYLVLSNPTFMN